MIGVMPINGRCATTGCVQAGEPRWRVLVKPLVGAVVADRVIGLGDDVWVRRAVRHDAVDEVVEGEELDQKVRVGEVAVVGVPVIRRRRHPRLAIEVRVRVGRRERTVPQIDRRDTAAATGGWCYG